jgi:hypothetical protein
MWKNLKNVVSAVSDLTVILSKEVSYQATKASEATQTVTSTLSTKAATLRTKYESDLADRKAGITKPTVVQESEVPTTTVAIN